MGSSSSKDDNSKDTKTEDSDKDTIKVFSTDKSRSDLPLNEEKNETESNKVTNTPELNLTNSIDKSNKVANEIERRKQNASRLELTNQLEAVSKVNSGLLKVGVGVAALIGSTGIGLPIAAPLLGIILISSLMIKKYAELVKLKEVFIDVSAITSRIFILFQVLQEGYKIFQESGVHMNEDLEINIRIKLNSIISYLNEKFGNEMVDAVSLSSTLPKGGGEPDFLLSRCSDLSRLQSGKKTLNNKGGKTRKKGGSRFEKTRKNIGQFTNNVKKSFNKKKSFLTLYMGASKIQTQLISELTLVNGYFILIYTELELQLKRLSLENNPDFTLKMKKWIDTPSYKSLQDLTTEKLTDKVLESFNKIPYSEKKIIVISMGEDSTKAEQKSQVDKDTNAAILKEMTNPTVKMTDGQITGEQIIDKKIPGGSTENNRKKLLLKLNNLRINIIKQVNGYKKNIKTERKKKYVKKYKKTLRK
jgi:hypothetical protein